ncbi:MAG: 50S ribosomal protein L16 [bacterium]|nr:50S ribosomal protein L16 [bacterium]
MLQPKRLKWRRPHRIYPTGYAWKGNQISFGEYGLQATSGARITARQIEAARIAMTRKIKRGGKIWIRIFPHQVITSKPLETRMGKGKGSPDHYVALVRPGTMMFEMSGVPVDLAKAAMRLAKYKLPCRTQFVVKQ